jgi:hypothetical protein
MTFAIIPYSKSKNILYSAHFRMRKLIVLLGLGLPCLVNAQLLSLPPSSSKDGVVIKPADVNGGTALWGSPTTLGAYQISGDGYQKPLHPGSADQELGLTWNYTPPSSLAAARQGINATGGIVRAIFVGETAGWLNDFGYTYSGVPSGQKSYTAWQRIQSFGAANNTNIKFGDYFDVNLAPGQMANFDFWLSAPGVMGPRPTSLTDLGGVYTAFNPSASSSPTQQYLWAASSLSVNTWIPSLSASAPVATYLAGIEDWRIDRGSDRDYNDFMFALQFYNSDGTPFTATAVPEPGTWAAIAGVLAFGFVLVRRYCFPKTL